MKFLYLSFFLLLFSFEGLPQEHKGHNPQRKIQQLEKIKLIETLELDDASAVKLFNLKDNHQKAMKELMEKSDKTLDNIQETLSSGESTNRDGLNELLNQYKTNSEQLFKLRTKFLSEVELLLTPEKYAKYLVFERNFKTEIRDLIMGDRMKRRKDRN